MNTQSTAQFDVVISGGGMIGATLALAISRRLPKLRVAVIEPQRPDSAAATHASFDLRAIALSAGSAAFLDELGIWQALAPHAEPIKHIHVSERGALALTRLHHDHFGLPALGHVVAVQPLGEVLWHELQAAEPITLFSPAKIAEFTRSESQVTVTLDDGQALSAKLLVGADGANSAIREQLQLPVAVHDYQQHAVIATVQSELPHNGWAYERLTDTGPLALLPLPGGPSADNRLSLVWSCSPERAEQLQAAEEETFLGELQQRFGWRLGKFTRAAGRFSYPLAMRQVNSPISHRVALVGNAAHALHPIAGQGYNLGLRDVIALLGQIELATGHTVPTAEQSSDPGLYRYLTAYQQQRAGDTALTLGWSDALVKVFAQQDLAIQILRRAGVNALNWLPAARATIGWQGMGLGFFGDPSQ